MGIICSKGHSYKITHNTQTFEESFPNSNPESALFGINRIIAYYYMQEQCVNCRKIKCTKVWQDMMDGFYDFNIKYDVHYKKVKNVTPIELMNKLQTVHNDACWKVFG